MNPPPAVRRLCRPYWLRIGGVTLAAAVAVTAAFALAGSAPVLTTFQHALVHSLVMGGLTGAVLPWVMRRLWGASFLTRWSVLVPALLALAAGGTVIACALLSLVDPHRTVGTCLSADLWINALMVATIGVGMILYEVQRARLDAMTLELRTRELEHERALTTALEARLATLESRLHPHFLFNTLNAISALIHDDPDRAERTVERLAALLRFALDATHEGVIPLGQEIKIVVDYLEIEHTRLGERLSYAVKVDPAVEACAIPPLAVQTLVENSIKHAIAPRPHGGQIRVEASPAAESVVLTVWDDGPGFTAADIRPGHGLENLQARLAARFGGSARLAIERHAGGTLVTVTQPRTVTTPTPLRAFLIDDEPLALKRLARMLQATGRVEIVGRATDPERGIAQLSAESVDVIFLDIHMPGLSGFEIVERLPRGPLVVFITAYDQHAVQAFELNAVDYLLKPVERARLDRTLDRVASRRDEPEDGDWRQTLEQLARQLRASPFLDHLASRVGDRVQLVAVDEVTHVFARDRGTYAATAAREHLLDVTLADLERKLDPARFLRIHRATLVNVRWIGELHSDIGGRLLLRLKDERRTDLVVSRDRVRAVKERLGVV